MAFNCTSNRGTVGYSAGPFSRVVFAVAWHGGISTFTNRNHLHRVEGTGVLVNTIFTESYRGQFRDKFIDTADLSNLGT